MTVTTIRTPAPSRPADTSVPLHPLLAQRWSSRSYAADGHVTDDELLALLEAARWSPSRSNGQTRRFLVGRRGDSTFARLHDALKPGNQAWAANAAVLIAAVTPTTDGGGQPDRLGAYDLGQAIANLTVQATALDLSVRQMAGFFPDVVRAAFGIPETHEPLVIIAIGAYADPASLSEELREKEQAARQRHPLDTIVFAGAWQQPLDITPARS